MKRNAAGLFGGPHPPLPSLNPARGTTPVPVALIDHVMPVLRDTELRVLLVVVRQTLGWQVGKDPYLRKERDWLTQSQLMRRTGRASEAVARAVDALVRRGLIDVLDGAERLLMTPAERRRCLGKLYYRLHKSDAPPLPGERQQAKRHAEQAPRSAEQNAGKAERAKSEHAKSHTTKKTLYKNQQTIQKIVDKSVVNSFVVRRSGWVRAAEAVPEQRKGEASAACPDG